MKKFIKEWGPEAWDLTEDYWVDKFESDLNELIKEAQREAFKAGKDVQSVTPAERGFHSQGIKKDISERMFKKLFADDKTTSIVV